MGHRNLRFAAVMGLHTIISAGTFLQGKPAADAIPTLALGLLRFLIAGAGFLVLARLRHLELWSVARSEWRTYLWAGFLLWFHALSIKEPSRVAIATNGQPVATAILAWIFYGQAITPAFAVGAVLVLGGVLLTQL